MNAKKPPPPEDGHAEQTRKVDGMSELVAGLLLAHPDGPLPDARPEATPTAPAVRASAPQEPAPLAPGTRVPRSVMIGLVAAIVLAALVAMVLLVVR